MRVAAAPEKGKANAALIRFLAEALDVSRAAVTLVAGQASRDKVIEVAGVSQADLDRRLDGVSESTR